MIAGNGDLEAAVFDLDGTITRNDTYLAYLFGYLRRRPLRAVRGWALPVAVAAFRMGRIDNSVLKAAFLKAFLAGSTREDLARWTDAFVPSLVRSHVRRMAVDRIEAHRAAGHRLVLASASLDLYVEPLATSLGFHAVVYTRCGWTTDGRLDECLAGPNLRGGAKLQAVRALLGDGCDGSRIVAYSDHPSDVPLLTWAGRGVAVNPDRKFAVEARALGLAVEYWT